MRGRLPSSLLPDRIQGRIDRRRGLANDLGHFNAVAGTRRGA
jgi:hypothetical protein